MVWHGLSLVLSQKDCGVHEVQISQFWNFRELSCLIKKLDVDEDSNV